VRTTAAPPWMVRGYPRASALMARSWGKR
jgi:hypothetical protein